MAPRGARREAGRLLSIVARALDALRQLALVEHRLDQLAEEQKRQAIELRLLDRRLTWLEATAEAGRALPLQLSDQTPEAP